MKYLSKNLLFVLTFLFSITLSAKQITVTSGADSGSGSLREAIEKANPNDTIVFGDSITTISLSSGFNLTKNITINGNKTENTTITCVARHFYIPVAEKPENTVTITLNNLTLKDGYETTCGGAIFNNSGGNTLTVNHCKFINNSTGKGSGCIDNRSILFVNDCLFEGNSCNNINEEDLVGAILNLSQAFINNSIFINNSSTSSSGALFNYNPAKMDINNCIFTGNKGGFAGVLINAGNVSLLNCLLTGNTSTNTKKLGTLYSYKLSNTKLDKAFISIINTTIADNIGEGIYNEQELLIQNSIIWNNVAKNDIRVTNDSNTMITHSLIGTSNFNIEGNHNIVNQNPLFVGNGNYQLKESSPAKDAGNNTLYPYTEYPKDLLGKNRISNTTIDMGAYEYQTEVPVDTIITINKHELTIYVDSVPYKLTSTVTPENQRVIWSSLNNNIASVDPNGNVKGIAKGETIVIATVGTVQDTCKVTVTHKMGVGSVNAERKSFVMYPNPAKDVLYIQTTEEIKSVTILDTKGCIIKLIPNYTTTIRISDLPNGVYLIRIQTLNGETTQRFVKQ